jgi:hypothetical protein
MSHLAPLASLCLLVSSLALAQAEAGAAGEDAGVSVAAPPPVAPPTPAAPAAPAASAAPAPLAAAPAAVAEPADAGCPECAACPSCASALTVDVGAQVRLSFASGSPVTLDDTGTAPTISPIESRLRFSGAARMKSFGLVAELDAVTGALVGTPDSSLVAARVPTPGAAAAELRELYLEYRWATGVARLGQQLSHFGIGMLSNAGKSDGEAGDFGQQHFGSLALRALVVSRPLFAWGGAWRAFEPALAVDLVVRDSTANLYEGDLAFQGIASLRFHVDDARLLSFTAIYRHQSPADNAALEHTDAWVLDLGGQWRFFESLSAGVELVSVLGTTTQTRSVDYPVLQLRQYGAAGKLKWSHGPVTVLFDAGYASGDSDPYDGQLTAFRFDRDFKVGLVLWDVLGWQSARTALRASDLGLVGVAPEGVKLLPTGGAVSSAAYLFPRVSGALCDWLDVYGGPMFAFTTAPLNDAFLTKTSSGGVLVNSLGGKGEGMLGTELDLGVAAHATAGRFSVKATLEGGVLLPGAAFSRPDGSVMGPVWMGRLRLMAAAL